MKTSGRTLFLKTAACPASRTLLSFRENTLSKKVTTQVREHLESCDFCNAERQLLAHHSPSRKGSKVPEMPMDLRILAESLLARR
jgi:hypothetical protein